MNKTLRKSTLGKITMGLRRRRVRPTMAALGFAVAAVLAVSACADMDPSMRGAGTGAAIGSGIALVTGASAGAVIGAGLIGGGVGYAGGTLAGGR
jgi:hypothetical protein